MGVSDHITLLITKEGKRIRAKPRVPLITLMQYGAVSGSRDSKMPSSDIKCEQDSRHWLQTAPRKPPAYSSNTKAPQKVTVCVSVSLKVTQTICSDVSAKISAKNNEDLT